jgi:hypothetical protein
MNIQLKEKEVIVDGVSYFLKEDDNNSTPQTEFKVGDWVIGSDGPDGRYYPRDPEKIKEVDDSGYYPYEYNGRDDHEEGWNCLSFVRLATKEEVESHLRKICEKKYVGKRIYAMSDDDLPDGYITGRLSNNHWQKYYPVDDSYFMTVNHGGFCVYKQGEWAEILPDKKALPKSREEFIFLLQDVLIEQPKGGSVRISEWANSYLDQYDFND